MLFVVIGGAYALGGADVYRSLRARVRSWTEPPTPRELQAAAAFAAARAVQDSIERVPTDKPKGVERPVSLGYAVGIIAIAMVFVAILLVVSTIWPRSPEARPADG